MIQIDFEKRFEEYQNDIVINQYNHIISDLMIRARPRITINFHSGEQIMDIDQESKDKIAVWQRELYNYIKNNYSDILCHQGKIEGQQ